LNDRSHQKQTREVPYRRHKKGNGGIINSSIEKHFFFLGKKIMGPGKEWGGDFGRNEGGGSQPSGPKTQERTGGGHKSFDLLGEERRNNSPIAGAVKKKRRQQPAPLHVSGGKSAGQENGQEKKFWNLFGAWWGWGGRERIGITKQPNGGNSKVVKGDKTEKEVWGEKKELTNNCLPNLQGDGAKKKKKYQRGSEIREKSGKAGLGRNKKVGGWKETLLS